MKYVLRANCHSASVTPLVLEALAPSVEAVTAKGYGAAVAYQPDWVGGRHIKVAVDGEDRDEVIECIARALQDHLDAHGGGKDTTPAEYERIQIGRGRLTSDSSPLRPNGVVERGDFTPPRPRNSENLGHIRDIFRSKTLDVQYRLRRIWAHDHGDAVAEFALHIMGLDRIEWADGINLWAMSVLAHADNYRHIFASEANAAILDEVELRLLSRLDSAEFRDNGSVGESARDWVRALQAQYDSHVAFWHANEELVSSWGRKDAEDEPPIPVSQDRWRQIASAPRRVIYRHMVNDLYDMQLTSGMTVAAKLLACHTIDRVLRRHMPETSRRIRDNASKM
jgi:hypothetical protein